MCLPPDADGAGTPRADTPDENVPDEDVPHADAPSADALGSVSHPVDPVRTVSRRAVLGSAVPALVVVGGCLGDGASAGAGQEDSPGGDGDGTTTTDPSSGAEDDGSWPMFGVDAANTGYAPDATLPGGGVSVRWRIDADRTILAPPSVAGGTAYAGSYDGVLHAVDLASGERRWTVEASRAFDPKEDPAPPRISTAPAVVDGVVYVGDGFGVVRAVDADDGTERWRFETDPAGEGSITGDPAVVDDVVYVGSGDSILAIRGGEELWRFQRGPDTGSQAPAVADGLVYAGGLVETDETLDRTVLHAIDATTGETAWTFEPDSRPGEDWEGSSRSRTGSDFRAWGGPAVADGVVYAGNTVATSEADRNHALYALDAETGERRWTFESGAAVRTSPAVADGIVHAGGTDGVLYALDAETGERRWSFETGTYVHSAPVVADGTVLHGSLDGTLYAIDAESGAERWSFDGGGGFGGPVVADGTVYVGDESGALYALDG